jgi:uncharacterized membrane-anchored protein
MCFSTILKYMLSTHRVSRKVPEITALFWIIKLLTTAMGEATSDFMVASYNQYLAVFVGGCALAIALLIQFKTRIYNPYLERWLPTDYTSSFMSLI